MAILIKRADALAAYLNQNCLTEDSLIGLDILDSLASLGFDLADDPEGHSSAAYFTVIHDAVVSPANQPKRARRLLRRRRHGNRQGAEPFSG